MTNLERFGVVRADHEEYRDIRYDSTNIKDSVYGYEKYQRAHLQRDYDEWVRQHNLRESWEEYIDGEGDSAELEARRYADKLMKEKQQKLYDYPDLTKWALGPEGPGVKVFSAVMAAEEVYKLCHFGNMSQFSNLARDKVDNFAEMPSAVTNR